MAPRYWKDEASSILERKMKEGHEFISRLQVEPHSDLILVIRNGSGELVVKAENKAELQRWEEALGSAVAENSKRRAKIMEDRAARGEVSEEQWTFLF